MIFIPWWLDLVDYLTTSIISMTETLGLIASTEKQKKKEKRGTVMYITSLAQIMSLINIPEEAIT